MEKYGFIYIWLDRKRKMFYIGSHWGTETDGYICSSTRMRNAYRRRPHDFKRRTIQKNIQRNMLLDQEHKWLQYIKEDELGNKYYNLRKHKWGHWSTDEKTRVVVGQKISNKLKGKPIPKNEEWRKNLSLSHKGKKLSPEHAAKCRLNGAKKYLITDHQGKSFFVFCLKDFSKKIGVRYNYIFRVSNGTRKQYKGYRVKKVE